MISIKKTLNSELKKYFFNHKSLAAFSAYTILFIIFGYLSLYHYIRDLHGIVLGDSVLQYHPMLIDLRRNIIHFTDSLLKGTPEIKMLNIDYISGSDTLTKSANLFLPFFPLFAFSVFLPEQSMAVFFTVCLIIIAYLSGITFMIMCSFFDLNRMWSSFFATTYVFCGFFFHTGTGNIQFLYMSFIFPIMIIGLELIIHHRNGLVFSFCIFFLTICFFYFIIYTVPFIIIYAIVRVFFIYSNDRIKNIAKFFIKGSLYSLLGIMAAGFSLLPYLYVFFNSIRHTGTIENIKEMMIPNAQYISSSFYPIRPDNPTGLCPVVIPLIFLMFLRSDRQHKVLSALMIILISLPFTRYASNAFQYDLCRWGFIPACLFCFIAARYVTEIFILSKKQASVFGTILILYSLIAYYNAKKLMIVLIFAFIIVSFMPKQKNRPSAIHSKIKMIISHVKTNRIIRSSLFAFTCIIIFVSVFYIIIGPGKIPYACFAVSIMFTTILLLMYFSQKSIKSTTISVILYSGLIICNAIFLADDSFMSGKDLPLIYDTSLAKYAGSVSRKGEIARFASADNEADNQNPFFSPDKETDQEEKHSESSYNLTLKYGFASSEVFTSLIDSDYINLLLRCGMDQSSFGNTGCISGYSGKEVLYSLFGVNNLYSENRCSMYGLKYKTSLNTSSGRYNIYENQYALPLGVTYSSMFSKERFLSLNSAELPYAMLDSVYLDNYELSDKISDAPADFSFVCDTDTNQKIYKDDYGNHNISYSHISNKSSYSNGFYYLTFTVNEIEKYSENEFYKMPIRINDSYEISCSIRNSSSNSPWAIQYDNYSIPLGYFEEPLSEISFKLMFDPGDVRLHFIPVNIYTDNIKKITQDTLNNIDLKTNSFSGELDVSEEKVLCINLIHSAGWEAFIDGKETQIYKANDIFMGIIVPEGKHTISFRYRIPMFYEGTVLSFAAFIISVIIIFSKKRSAEPH